MKIPHPLFVLINRIMVVLLRSPLHRLFSGSITAIGYTGRRSGRRFWVPARYMRHDQSILVVTSMQTKWWPNFGDGLEVDLLLGGNTVQAHASASTDQPDEIAQAMRGLWEVHPGDAAYMNVKMRGRVPDAKDFTRALEEAVLVRLVLHESFL